LITTLLQQNKTASFRIIDSATARPDLTSRSETKYALTQTDPGKIRCLLESNCRRLVHNQPVSTVRSIYFDDAGLSACRANLDGLGTRRKLRLRWYDTLLPGNDFFFEVKWRDNRLTGKHRFHVQSNIPLAQLSWRQIHRGLEAVLPGHVQRDLLRYTEPIAIVQYRREHFATDDGLRITLDHDLTWYDQSGRSMISTSFPRRLDGLIVLEGKTPVGRDGELRRWLHPLAPRVGRCSKYVHGCCQLGLIRSSEM
jgi:VTC domain